SPAARSRESTRAREPGSPGARPSMCRPSFATADRARSWTIPVRVPIVRSNARAHGRPHARGLLDQLIRTPKQRQRNGQAQRLRGLELDGKRELRRLLDRKITRLGTLEDLVDVARGAAMHLRLVRSVRDQETRLRLPDAPPSPDPRCRSIGQSG